MDKDNKLFPQVFALGGTFHGIDIEKCLEDDKKKQLVSNLLKEAIDKGIVKPLERQAFPENKILDAFTFMSTGDHVGKILININQENGLKLKSQAR